MAFPEDIFSELIRVCQGLSRSVEARYLPDELQDLPIRDLRQFHLAMQFLREPLNLTEIRRHRRDPQYLQNLLREFVGRLDRVRSDEQLYPITSRVPFRLAGSRVHRYGEPILHDALFSRNITISDALKYLDDTVASISLDLLVSEDNKSAIDTGLNKAVLGRILPKEQVPAPAQFKFNDGKLRIAHQPARAEARDETNVSSAQAEIIARGQQIIDSLKESNVDPRLLNGIEELQKRVLSNEDVIRTGITNITCSHLIEQSKAEIPNTLYGLLQGHSLSINMFVGQFPEWRRFAEQAATAAIESEHVPHISAAARQIATELSKDPELADPEVPRLLTHLAELISEPKKAGRRAAFAVLRTIENLVLSVYTSVSVLLSKTLTKSVEGLSAVMSRVIVIAVAGAIVLGPVAQAIPEVSWVKQATEIVIQELKGQGIRL